MWRWHVLVVVVVVGFGAGVGWSSAQQTDAERARLSGQDYAEIYPEKTFLDLTVNKIEDISSENYTGLTW